jgi:hypothetical protein
MPTPSQNSASPIVPLSTLPLLKIQLLLVFLTALSWQTHMLIETSMSASPTALWLMNTCWMGLVSALVSVLLGYSWKIQQKDVKQPAPLALPNQLRATASKDASETRRLLATSASATTAASTQPSICTLTTPPTSVYHPAPHRPITSQIRFLATASFGVPMATFQKLPEELARSTALQASQTTLLAAVWGFVPLLLSKLMLIQTLTAVFEYAHSTSLLKIPLNHAPTPVPIILGLTLFLSIAWRDALLSHLPSVTTLQRFV